MKHSQTLPHSEQDNCSRAVSSCAARYLGQCGMATEELATSSQSSETASYLGLSSGYISTSFVVRRDSCIRSPTAGFWRHLPYIFRGQFKEIRALNTDLEQCMHACGETEDCTLFEHQTTDYVCRLKSGEVVASNMCNPHEQTGCVSTAGQVVYARDADDFYCSPMATECACVRHYQECMESTDCAQTSEELLVSLEMCQSLGCSALQCGLGAVDDPRICATGFIECISSGFNASTKSGVGASSEGLESARGDSCACTRQYAECRGSDAYLNASVNYGGRVIDICLEEGCSNEECQRYSCATRQRLCTDSLMACHNRSLNVLAWKPRSILQGTREGGAGAGRGNPAVSAQGATWVQGPAEIEWLDSAISLRSGKWYFEVSVSGLCGYAGVVYRDGHEKGDLEPGMSNHSWAFGSDDTGLSLWHDSVASLIGTSTSNAVLAIALDADHGELQFARDGVFVAHVSTGRRGGAWSPALRRGCSQSGGLSLRMLSHRSALRFPSTMPGDHLALESDVCSCFAGYVDCLEAGSCEGAPMAAMACQECVGAGCSFESCGLSARTCTSQVGSSQCVGCLAIFQRCSLDECDCIQSLSECMAAADCVIEEADAIKNAEMCIYHECWDYSYCAEVLNVPSQVQCSQDFLACQNDSAALSGEVSDGRECACQEEWFRCITTCVDLDNSTSARSTPLRGICAVLSEVYLLQGAQETQRQCQYYQDNVAVPHNLASGPFHLCCVCGGGGGGGVYRENLVKDSRGMRSLSKQHFDMCAANGCAHVCGENPWYTCDEISVKCGNALVACRDNATRLHSRNDSCSLLYRGGGGAYCSQTAYGGLEGCNYDPVADLCQTHPDCVCFAHYHQCVTKHVEKCPHILEVLGEECSRNGCSAAQCGLEELGCNGTSLVCANQYLHCALKGKPSSDQRHNECYGQCLRAYYMCMTLFGCIDSLNNHQHSMLCEESGCSIAECGLTLQPEMQFLPDAPQRALLTSMPNNSIQMAWVNSSLSLEWLNQGSINTLLEYHIVLRTCTTGDELMEPDEADFSTQSLRCSVIIKEMDVGFFGQSRAILGNLRVGAWYQLAVTASNLAGTGPAALQFHKLLGPPSPPTSLTISIIGPLQLEIQWGMPSQAGGGSSSEALVPLQGYELSILASDGRGGESTCGLRGR